jgi:hypothetical protein
VFDGNIEEKEAPEKFTAEEVSELLQRVSHVQPGVTDTGLKRKRGGKGDQVIYNCKSAWWKLPYWKDLLLPHNYDVMHIEKNICDNLLGPLLKLEGKTKDTLNSRIDLVAMGIRHKLHPYQEGHVVKTPPAWYVLKAAQRITFC